MVTSRWGAKRVPIIHGTVERNQGHPLISSFSPILIIPFLYDCYRSRWRLDGIGIAPTGGVFLLHSRDLHGSLPDLNIGGHANRKEAFGESVEPGMPALSDDLIQKRLGAMPARFQCSHSDNQNFEIEIWIRRPGAGTERQRMLTPVLAFNLSARAYLLAYNPHGNRLEFQVAAAMRRS